MDGAQACYLYFAGVARRKGVPLAGKPPRVGGRGGPGAEGAGVSPSGTAPSADLGGSSNYSNGNFED